MIIDCALISKSKYLKSHKRPIDAYIYMGIKVQKINKFQPKMTTSQECIYTTTKFYSY